MRGTAKVLFVLIASCSAIVAEVPKSPSMMDYRIMLTRSPWVIKKPAAPIVQPTVNSSLTLRGVAKLSDGWFVTVVDRKAPNENIVLREGRPTNAKGLRLMRVNQDKKDYKKTTAVVLSSGRELTIGYSAADIKNSLAKSTAVVQPKTNTKPASSARPPLPTATKPAATSSSTRRPRVRRAVTPPPVPKTQ